VGQRKAGAHRPGVVPGISLRFHAGREGRGPEIDGWDQVRGWWSVHR